jgi:hypothetical protein
VSLWSCKLGKYPRIPERQYYSPTILTNVTEEKILLPISILRSHSFEIITSIMTSFPWQVRMDPRNKEVDLDNLMYGTIGRLTEQELKKQEADYIYRYRYNGGGSTQVWLSSGRW